uniref:CSON013921 protein n=1 Tax=Culicoides sonorensis TaxID=179676 RepID=A0A336M986_CULSO
MPGLIIKPWFTYDANEPLPENPVRGGKYTDGSILYAGRSYYAGDLLPAMIFINHLNFGTVARVSHNGREITQEHGFEILLPDGLYVWRSESNGGIPFRAIEIGHTVDREVLYLGRGRHQGAVIVGKVHPSHNCLYIPFGGREIALRQYEVFKHWGLIINFFLANYIEFYWKNRLMRDKQRALA